MFTYTIITKKGERFTVDAASGDAATKRAEMAGFEVRTGDILVAPNGKRYPIFSGSRSTRHVRSMRAVKQEEQN